MHIDETSPQVENLFEIWKMVKKENVWKMNTRHYTKGKIIKIILKLIKYVTRLLLRIKDCKVETIKDTL